MLDSKLGVSPRPRTFPGTWPIVPLDRIWVQPSARLRTIDAHHSALAKRASDHLPLVAVVELG